MMFVGMWLGLNEQAYRSSARCCHGDRPGKVQQTVVDEFKGESAVLSLMCTTLHYIIHTRTHHCADQPARGPPRGPDGGQPCVAGAAGLPLTSVWQTCRQHGGLFLRFMTCSCFALDSSWCLLAGRRGAW
eukprot:281182-Chlamydomonas_euryale.AAC.1